jgi:transcriptional regulator with XRE-family HTH domain
MTIGSNVKRFRHQHGLTQEELGIRTGMAKTTISSIEVDYRLPSVKVVKKLAKALHCTTDELLFEKGGLPEAKGENDKASQED